MQDLQKRALTGKTFVLCMKGIEIGTGKRLSEVASEYIGENNHVAVWIGPGHVQEFYRGIPNCMVIDSEDEMVKRALVEAFSSELIRFYYGQDLIGNEIGAAAKNVIWDSSRYAGWNGLIDSERCIDVKRYQRGSPTDKSDGWK